MTYHLHIDNKNEPQRDGKKWQTATSITAAEAILKTLGAPKTISMNYDLGKGQLHGDEIARWLVQLDLNHNVIAEDLEYMVHGGSVVDATKMKMIVRNYMNFKFKAKTA